MTQCEPQGCQWNNNPNPTPGQPATRSVATSNVLRVTVKPKGKGITVTAPNGGEQWQEGVLNTVTWMPYQYNPDVNPAKDVTAYLEVNDCYPGKDAPGSECFRTLGKVQESGKASIHWITGELNSASQGGTYAPAGSGYYIRVVNNVTGASDRSNAPFTLLPKPVDIKVNGSDGPVALTPGAAVTVSWTSQQGVTGCQFFGFPDISFSSLQSSSGSLSGHITSSYGNTSVGIQCVYNGSQISDYVFIVMGPQNPASLQITSPNGGEKLSLSDVRNISWKEGGIKNVSVALYKNDQWYKWIWKDLSSSLLIGTDGKFAPWRPSEPETFISNTEVALGSAFKIYITGQKVDGSGYVDDKSDAPFSFVSGTTDVGTFAASPTSGSAPLVVAFNSSATSVAGQTFSIKYGDGQSGGFDKGVTHTYTTPGIYTATLIRSGCSLYAASAVLATSLPYCPLTEIGNVTIDVKPAPGTSGLSPWGQKLSVQDASIPNGSFRAFVFNRDTNGNPTTQIRAQSVIDEPYLNYLSWSGGYGAALDKQIGAYFVGKFTYGNPSPPITFDLSNPQWDIARLYIDGQLVHTYGGNSGSPTYSRSFAGGTHIFELEYDSRWHAGTFAMRVGRIVTPGYTNVGSIPAAITSLKTQYPGLKVAAASVYESPDNVNGDVTVNLPTFTSPTVLVFSSYDPVRWRWIQNTANLGQVKAIVVYTFAGAGIPDLVGSIPVYQVRGEYIGSGSGATTAQDVSQKIGHPVDMFVQEYSPTSLTVPVVTASSASVSSAQIASALAALEATLSALIAQLRQ